MVDIFHLPRGSMGKLSNVMHNPFSKIILGTVQLGMPYGLGRWKDMLMPESEAFAILDAAWEMGITTLDTSPDYGVAEARIAKYLKVNKSKPFQIVSKIKQIPSDIVNVKLKFKSYFDACPFAGFEACSSLSVLLHKEADIYRPEVLDELDAAVQRGQIMQWGVSVYGEAFAIDAEKIETCLLIQLPFGVLNQSFARSGCIDCIGSKTTLLHARSLFAQGLLFLENDSLQDLSPEIKDIVNHVAKMASLSSQSKMQLGLRFVLSMAQINSAVLGVDTVEQLSELAKVITDPLKKNDISLLARLFELAHQDAVRPEMWG